MSTDVRSTREPQRTAMTSNVPTTPRFRIVVFPSCQPASLPSDDSSDQGPGLGLAAAGREYGIYRELTSSPYIRTVPLLATVPTWLLMAIGFS